MGYGDFDVFMLLCAHRKGFVGVCGFVYRAWAFAVGASTLHLVAILYDGSLHRCVSI